MTRFTLTLAALLLGSFVGRLTADEVIITFNQAETGKPVASHTQQDVVFAPAHQSKRGKTAAKVMFFSHLKTERKGILNALADEPIPVEIRLPKPASTVTLVLWGSIGSQALVEAYDKNGKVIDTVKQDKVPERDAPNKPIPSVELTVKGTGITILRFSGASAGGYLVCDEVRYTPEK